MPLIYQGRRLLSQGRHQVIDKYRVKYLWADLIQCFQKKLILLTLTLQVAILGIL